MQIQKLSNYQIITLSHYHIITLAFNIWAAGATMFLPLLFIYCRAAGLFAKAFSNSSSPVLSY
jgi:hypothetical protein